MQPIISPEISLERMISKAFKEKGAVLSTAPWVFWGNGHLEMVTVMVPSESVSFSMAPSVMWKVTFWVVGVP